MIQRAWKMVADTLEFVAVCSIVFIALEFPAAIPWWGWCGIAAAVLFGGSGEEARKRQK